MDSRLKGHLNPLVIVLLVGLVLAFVGFQGQNSKSIISPLTPITLFDDKQYWVGTFTCDSAPIGTSFEGFYDKGNQTVGSQVYGRTHSVQVGCVPQQPYLQTSASLVNSLNSCTQGSFPCSVVSNTLEKLNLPFLGEKHAPFLFSAYSFGDNLADTVFDGVTYDQVGVAGAIKVGSTGVEFSNLGQLGTGYTDPSLSNVLLFRGKNPFICGDGVFVCDFQLESTAFYRPLSDSDLVKYGFPFLNKPTCTGYVSDCRLRVPSEIYDYMKDSSSWSLTDGLGAALRKY